VERTGKSCPPFITLGPQSPMVSTRALSVRWLLFTASFWAITAAGVYVYWASAYVLAPLFLPFSAYEFSGGQWTVFSEKSLGWPINIVYTVVLALAATWLGRRLTLGKSVALFALVVVVASLSVHGLMAAIGYSYWYDTP